MLHYRTIASTALAARITSLATIDHVLAFEPEMNQLRG
jgi:hypothetical protein